MAKRKTASKKRDQRPSKQANQRDASDPSSGTQVKEAGPATDVTSAPTRPPIQPPARNQALLIVASIVWLSWIGFLIFAAINR